MTEVLLQAERRADALAEADADALTRLLHPAFRWTSHREEVFDRQRYMDSNTHGELVWSRQTITDAVVAVVDDTAVLAGTVADEVERANGHQVLRMPMT